MTPRSRKTSRHFEHAAEFRFYAELNDFLAPSQQQQSLPYLFNGNPGIKDPIEVFGIPHTEVELIIVNGEPVGFDYKLQNTDRVAVYPPYKSVDIASIMNLRANLPHPIAFVADVNLGKLARLLRLLGFDTVFNNSLGDKEIIALALAQERIILTRDRRLLYAKQITHGYWLRSVAPQQQLAEIVRRFNLSGAIKPFYRCTVCNGIITSVDKQTVQHLLEPKTQKYYQLFYCCQDCGKVYWEGSHIDHIKIRFAQYLREGE